MGLAMFGWPRTSITVEQHVELYYDVGEMIYCIDEFLRQ